MNDLLRRRRAIMNRENTEEEELYPVGTEILGEYIGRNGTKLLLTNRYGLDW